MDNDNCIDTCWLLGNYKCQKVSVYVYNSAKYDAPRIFLLSVVGPFYCPGRLSAPEKSKYSWVSFPSPKVAVNLKRDTPNYYYLPKWAYAEKMTLLQAV